MDHCRLRDWRMLAIYSDDRLTAARLRRYWGKDQRKQKRYIGEHGSTSAIAAQETLQTQRLYATNKIGKPAILASMHHR